jgi:hypothetical protein
VAFCCSKATWEVKVAYWSLLEICLKKSRNWLQCSLRTAVHKAAPMRL